MTAIEKEISKSTDFRQVLHTGKHSQLVPMSLKPEEEIGEVTDKTVDRFFRFEEGEGKVVIEGVIIVSKTEMQLSSQRAPNITWSMPPRNQNKLYTIYPPP